MGNKTSQQTVHDRGLQSDAEPDNKPNRKPYQDNVEQLYKKLLGSVNEESDILEIGKSYFGAGGSFPHLGEILSVNLLHMPGATEEERFKKFTQGGSTILGLVSPAEQQEFYSKLFTKNKQQITKEDAESILDSAFQVAVATSGLTAEQTSADVIRSAIIKSIFQGRDDTGCTSEQFSAWCCKHCPHLLDVLHAWSANSLKGHQPDQHQVEAEALLPDLQAVLTNSCLLTLPVLWALTSSLVRSYLPSDFVQEGSASSTVTSTGHPLASFVEYGGWSLLYNSNSQGLSLNRFQHHVFDYKGPTIMLILFDQNLYCVATDTEWREGTQRWGGLDCRIIQILPQYKSVQDGSGIFYLNTQSRNVPKGFQFGRDPKTLVLQIDDGMSKVKHYGIEIPLHRVEVWGCGSSSTRNSQLQQKKWENQQAQKEKQRKLKLEDWKDNPDRQLLNMGGVEVEHAQR